MVRLYVCVLCMSCHPEILGTTIELFGHCVCFQANFVTTSCTELEAWLIAYKTFCVFLMPILGNFLYRRALNSMLYVCSFSFPRASCFSILTCTRFRWTFLARFAVVMASLIDYGMTWRLDFGLVGYRSSSQSRRGPVR